MIEPDNMPAVRKAHDSSLSVARNLARCIVDLLGEPSDSVSWSHVTSMSDLNQELSHIARRLSSNPLRYGINFPVNGKDLLW